MKKKHIGLRLLLCCVVLSFVTASYGQSSSPPRDKDLLKALAVGAQYTLNELRPTAGYRDFSVEKWRDLKDDDVKYGAIQKYRLDIDWKTAFTGKVRYMFVDVWVSKAGNDYLLHAYKWIEDDHNVLILNDLFKDYSRRPKVLKFKRSGGGGGDDDF